MPMEEFLYSKLNEKWCEEVPVLFDYIMLIQDEMIQTHIDELGPLPGQNPQDESVKIEFSNPAEA